MACFRLMVFTKSAHDAPICGDLVEYTEEEAINYVRELKLHNMLTFRLTTNSGYYVVNPADISYFKLARVS